MVKETVPTAEEASPAVPGLAVYLLCGPSLAGKTTVARRVREVLGATIVSADSLHEERGLPFGAEGLPEAVWAETLDTMLEQLRERLAAGRSVIVDDTLCYRWIRDRFRRAAEEAGAEPVLFLLAPSARVLIERHRRLRASKRRPVLSRARLREHLDAFEWPAEDEGPIDVTDSRRLDAWLDGRGTVSSPEGSGDGEQ